MSKMFRSNDRDELVSLISDLKKQVERDALTKDTMIVVKCGALLELFGELTELKTKDMFYEIGKFLKINRNKHHLNIPEKFTDDVAYGATSREGETAATQCIDECQSFKTIGGLRGRIYLANAKKCEKLEKCKLYPKLRVIRNE